MTKQEFEALATKFTGGPGIEYNSNNSWGFGGSVGLRWDTEMGDGKQVTIRVAKGFTRHQKPVKFLTITISGVGRIFDETQTSSNFDRAAKMLIKVAEIHDGPPKEDAQL